MTGPKHLFASDNCAGAHPDVVAAVTAVSSGHEASYGADRHTNALRGLVKQHFGAEADVFPLFTGTGANVVALDAMTRGMGGVICADTAHLLLDEGGAPERVAGVKLLPVPGIDGKLSADLIDHEAHGFDDVHHVEPQVVSVAQSTEYGTTYGTDELQQLCARAHSHGLAVHMDGARLANAAAHLELPLRALTTDVGVDVLSFGGTKNGLMAGEAVVTLNPRAARAIDRSRKMSTQLGSKMRFVSAQLGALLDGDLWLRNARHANAMARRLELAVSAVPGVVVSRPVEANSVFVLLPSAVIAALQETYAFSLWEPATGEVRWMTSWDTDPHVIDTFVSDLRRVMAVHVSPVARAVSCRTWHLHPQLIPSARHSAVQKGTCS